MMTTFLFATDFSDNSTHALKYVLKAYGGKFNNLIIAHAYYAPHAGASALVSIENMVRKESEEQMQKLLEDHKDELSGYQVDHYCVYGDLQQAIKGIAKKHVVDMVIMGTKGAGDARNVFFGSTAVDVLKNVNIPTLIVPDQAKVDTVKRIGFAADFASTSGDSVKPLAELVKKSNAELIIFHIEKSTVPDTEFVFPSFDEFQNIPHLLAHVQDEDVIHGIETVIEDNKIDLMAMVAHHYNFLDNLFHKSITKKMIMNSEIPVLILHD